MQFVQRSRLTCSAFYSHKPLFLHHMQIFVIALTNCSSDVNVVYEGSPSRILRVLLISLGITIRPRSSTLLTIPVAVPDICLRRRRSLASVDRGHSLRSLLPPPAALPSLPSSFHISFSFYSSKSLPLEGKVAERQRGRMRCCRSFVPPHQSASLTASPQGEAFAPTIILQIK